MYTTADLSASYNHDTGQTTYSLPNGNSITPVGRTPIGNTSSGLAFLRDSLDSQVNAVNQEVLWKREDMLRKLAEEREDYSMDRLVEAAKRNGINPIFLLDSLSASTVGNAASYSTSAAKTNNYAESAKTDQANSAKIVAALIAALGVAAAAILK